MKLGLLLLFACAGCAQTPLYVSGHPTTAHDGAEWHSCPGTGGGECREGYACVKDGCEWCGSDDGIQTRCTNATD